jgi:hypothetical protein
MYSLEIEPMDLGADVKSVSLELIDPENREPARGSDAAAVWSRVLPAIAAAEPWALDFFAHLDRVRDYCQRHNISFREAAPRCLVIPSPLPEQLAPLLERFEGETFGARAGALLTAADAALESDLSHRGVDAYHAAFANYAFCAVCDFENGFLTLLSNRLWASEVIRRVTPALKALPVQVRVPA